MTKRWLLMSMAIAFVVVFSLGDIQVTHADFGMNWTAQYFKGTTLSGDVVRTDTGVPGINFNWGSGSPDPAALGVDDWSARYSSVQMFAEGVYEFILTSDDGARVYIDGVLVLDQFIGRPLTTDRFERHMTQGAHNIVVEYFEGIDQAQIQFQWFMKSGSGGGVIPPNVIPGFQTPFAPMTPLPTAVPTRIPPTPLPPIPDGALTATVINARVLKARSAPTTGAGQIGRLLRGQTYAVIGRDPDARWFLLQLSGFQGWAMGHYLYIDGNEFNAPVVSSYVLEGNPASVSGNVAQARVTLRLRAAPSQDSQQIGRAAIGSMLPLISRTADGRWFQTQYKGTTGWVAWFQEDWLKLFEGNYNDIPVHGG